MPVSNAQDPEAVFAAFECQRLRLRQDQHVPEWIYKSRIAAKLAEEFVVLLGMRSAEAFFAARAARQRARRTKATAVAQQCLGRLTLAPNQAGAQLFVTWPALAGDLADEAKIAARAAGWRPQLWSTGARLHSDTALGDGPFLLTHTEVPRADQPAYDGAAAVFGEGSLIAATLAGRSVDWSETLLFDLNEDRTRGEQRFGPFDATVGPVWIASSAAITVVDRLRPLGTVAGYRIFEADLASDAAATFELDFDPLTSGFSRAGE